MSLEGEVKFSEVCVIANHKGNTGAVKKRSTWVQKPFKRNPWQRHSGKRKTANLWHDPAWSTGCFRMFD